MDTIMEVKALSFAYREVPVLERVNFTIYQGDFVSLIGSNGAGKSTLLKLLLGELAPDRGRILWFGQDIAQFRHWPAVGYVPQSGTSLAEGFPATVAEVVAMGLYSAIGPVRLPGHRHRQKVMAALALVGMEDYAKRMVGRLSGGQMQRVLIARALAGDAPVLLLDEPTTGVDSASTQGLYELLRELNRQRKLTILMVTHDTARSTPFVTRTFCLEEGSLVELDKEQIAHEMQHRHRH